MSYCWRIRERVLQVASGYKKILWGSSRVSLCWCNGWVHFSLRNVFELETTGENRWRNPVGKTKWRNVIGLSLSTQAVLFRALHQSTSLMESAQIEHQISVQGDFELFSLRAWRPRESSRIRRCTRTPNLLLHPLQCQPYLRHVALPVIPGSWPSPIRKTLNYARMVSCLCV